MLVAFGHSRLPRTIINGRPFHAKRSGVLVLYLFLSNPNSAPSLLSTTYLTEHADRATCTPSSEVARLPLAHTNDLSLRSNVICQTRKVTAHMFDKFAFQPVGCAGAHRDSDDRTANVISCPSPWNRACSICPPGPVLCTTPRRCLPA